MSLTEDQKNYLAGFVLGQDVARTVKGLAPLSGGGTRLQLGGDPALEETVTDIPAAGHTTGGTESTAAGPVGPVAPEIAAYNAQDFVMKSGRALAKEEQAKRQKNPLDLSAEMRNLAAELQPRAAAGQRG